MKREELVEGTLYYVERGGGRLMLYINKNTKWLDKWNGVWRVNPSNSSVYIHINSNADVTRPATEEEIKIYEKLTETTIKQHYSIF